MFGQVYRSANWWTSIENLQIGRILPILLWGRILLNERSKSESICKRIYIDIGFSIDNNTTSSIVNELAQFVGIFHCVDSFISRDERQKDENYRKSSVNKLKNQLSKSTFFDRNSTTAKFLIRRIFVREST